MKRIIILEIYDEKVSQIKKKWESKPPNINQYPKNFYFLI